MATVASGAGSIHRGQVEQRRQQLTVTGCPALTGSAHLLPLKRQSGTIRNYIVAEPRECSVPRSRRSRSRQRIVMAPAPPPDTIVVGGRVDSQGRLMLQHANGIESVAGKVVGAPGKDGTSPAAVGPSDTQMADAVSAWMTAHPAAPAQPGAPGKDATDVQVAAAISAWMAANPATQVVYNVAIPPTTVVLAAVTANVTVTWPKAWPDATYQAVAFVVTSGVLLGKIVAGEPKAKTTTSCVIPVDIAATLAAGGAKMHVIGMRA